MTKIEAKRKRYTPAQLDRRKAIDAEIAAHLRCVAELSRELKAIEDATPTDTFPVQLETFVAEGEAYIVQRHRQHQNKV